jgi:hypothetical protein
MHGCGLLHGVRRAVLGMDERERPPPSTAPVQQLQLAEYSLLHLALLAARLQVRMKIFLA